MGIAQGLKQLFPDAVPDRDYLVKNDGNGTYITGWQLADPIPSAAELSVASLVYLKAQHKKELSAECNQRIYNGFHAPSNGHNYQFELLDQINFNQQYSLMLADPSIAGTVWKSVDAGTYQHTREEFMNVCSDSETHKRGHIGHYWTLCGHIDACTTEEQVRAINWNTVQCPVPSFDYMLDA